MEKQCSHGKWFNNHWVSFYNQIDDELEKCSVCGDIRENPLPDFNDNNVEDIGDEGEFSRKLNNEIDIHYALKRLSPRQKQVAELILEGYKEVEIAKKLGINQSSVSKLLKRVGHILGNKSL